MCSDTSAKLPGSMSFDFSFSLCMCHWQANRDLELLRITSWIWHSRSISHEVCQLQGKTCNSGQKLRMKDFRDGSIVMTTSPNLQTNLVKDTDGAWTTSDHLGRKEMHKGQMTGMCTGDWRGRGVRRKLNGEESGQGHLWVCHIFN